MHERLGRQQSSARGLRPWHWGTEGMVQGKMDWEGRGDRYMLLGRASLLEVCWVVREAVVRLLCQVLGYVRGLLLAEGAAVLT